MALSSDTSSVYQITQAVYENTCGRSSPPANRIRNSWGSSWEWVLYKSSLEKSHAQPVLRSTAPDLHSPVHSLMATYFVPGTPLSYDDFKVSKMVLVLTGYRETCINQSLISHHSTSPAREPCAEGTTQAQGDRKLI